ncbi:MAG: CRISPR-associated helicase Cas3' [Candidatus Micrarchaeia archaeon]
MKLLWDDYSKAVGTNKVYYAHCNETVDEHGRNSLIQLDNILRYLGDIQILRELLNKEDTISIIKELTYFHDLGKCDDEFQRGLNSLCNANIQGNLPSHSEKGFKMISKHIFTCGKSYAENNIYLLGLLLSTIIDRHHSDLRDLEEFELVSSFLPSLLVWSSRKNREYALYFLYRLAYSCLKTADILASIHGSHSADIEKNIITPSKIEEYEKNLEEYIGSKKANVINNYRELFRKKAIERITDIIRKNQKARVFFLYLPTGGGKTLTSVSIALKLAKEKNLKRIIYVFPYINIIEQNTLVLENIFENDVKAIHTYSDIMDVEIEKIDNETNDYKRKLAFETFDSPVVLISSVRFFDILFSNKKRAAMKLWAFANSVVILDEVQYFPKRYWEALIVSLTEFSSSFNIYFILMSATLPNLKIFLSEDRKELIVKIIDEGDFTEEFRKFELRTDIKLLKTNKEQWDTDVANKVKELVEFNRKILVVLNTIRMSRVMYRKLQEEIKDAEIYLLNSTIIYPRRLEILDAFSNDAESKKILVSTQSIEAGVDLDFDVGIREYAPPEAILQIAGRVNREFTKNKAVLYVTSSSETVSKVYGDYRYSNSLRADEVNDRQKIREYFEREVERLRRIDTESPKLLADMTDLRFGAVGQNRIISEIGVVDLFLEGNIKIDYEYSIGNNKILVARKIRSILENCGIKKCWKDVGDGISLDTYKFSNEYDAFLLDKSNLPYDKRFNLIPTLKKLNALWRMFSFPLRDWEAMSINYREDDRGRKWIKEGEFYYIDGGLDIEKSSNIV